MLTGPVHSTGRHEDHVESIRRACDWLSIAQGRAAAYAKLITQFFSTGTRTEEQVLAYNESCEIVELFELWHRHAEEFPGLRERLREVCRKGPTLRGREARRLEQSTSERCVRVPAGWNAVDGRGPGRGSRRRVSK